jgi:hypothetical protein
MLELRRRYSKLFPYRPAIALIEVTRTDGAKAL